jgi:hypothetical protein
VLFRSPAEPPAEVPAADAPATAPAAEQEIVHDADVVSDRAAAERANGQGIGVAASAPPGPEEIERRRQLVRTLFNDFWSGRFDKPAAFVDRLNEAETYLNERLAATGEAWQLDPATRKMLGLPPRSIPRSHANGSAHH